MSAKAAALRKRLGGVVMPQNNRRCSTGSVALTANNMTSTSSPKKKTTAASTPRRMTVVDAAAAKRVHNNTSSTTKRPTLAVTTTPAASPKPISAVSQGGTTSATKKPTRASFVATTALAFSSRGEKKVEALRRPIQKIASPLAAARMSLTPTTPGTRLYTTTTNNNSIRIGKTTSEEKKSDSSSSSEEEEVGSSASIHNKNNNAVLRGRGQQPQSFTRKRITRQRSKSLTSMNRNNKLLVGGGGKRSHPPTSQQQQHPKNEDMDTTPITPSLRRLRTSIIAVKKDPNVLNHNYRYYQDIRSNNEEYEGDDDDDEEEDPLDTTHLEAEVLTLRARAFKLAQQWKQAQQVEAKELQEQQYQCQQLKASFAQKVQDRHGTKVCTTKGTIQKKNSKLGQRDDEDDEEEKSDAVQRAKSVIAYLKQENSSRRQEIKTLRVNLFDLRQKNARLKAATQSVLELVQELRDVHVKHEQDKNKALQTNIQLLQEHHAKQVEELERRTSYWVTEQRLQTIYLRFNHTIVTLFQYKCKDAKLVKALNSL